jgi:hypothetical protein
MSPVREVSFELERFGWAEEGRLEVIGRWSGLRGRRVGRAALTVAGRRLSALPGGQMAAPGEDWRAVFAYDGDPADVAGAELEIGRSIVVDLPPPRRRRRRPATGETPTVVAARDLAAARAEADAATAEADALREQLAALRESSADADEIETLRAELAAARADAEALRGRSGDEASELAGLRLALGSLRASHEQLEDELEELRGVRDERDRVAGELEQLRVHGADEERVKADLGQVIHELQDRAAQSDSAREQLMAEVTEARGEIASLSRRLSVAEAELGEARADAQRRLDAERATTTEVHSRLATAREEAQRTMAAEAEETERLRRELDAAREEAERLLAAERSEVARLREELIAHDGEEDESTRRMLERIARDLDRERSTTRELRRELDQLRSDTARHRRFESAAVANGTTTMDEPVDRGVRTPAGTQRRVDAARVASARRVPRVPPHPASLWAVRVAAALLVAVLGVALVLLLSALT